MKKIQNHTGTGDNIGGDKITGDKVQEMRFQNKTIDRLKERLRDGELTLAEYEIRVLYFGLGYDLGHSEGFDEGWDQEGRYTKGYDAGYSAAVAERDT